MNILLLFPTRTPTGIIIAITDLVAKIQPTTHIVGHLKLNIKLKKDMEVFLTSMAGKHSKTTVYVFDKTFFKKLSSHTSTPFKLLKPLTIGDIEYIALPHYTEYGIQFLSILKGALIFLTRKHKTDIKYITVDSTNVLQNSPRILEGLVKYTGVCAFDIETDAKLDLTAKIVSVAFTFEKVNIVLIDMHTPEMVELLLGMLKELRKNKIKIIAHNAVFEIIQIINNFITKYEFNITKLNEGLDLFKYIEDTRLLAYCAFNNTNTNILNLKQFGYEYFGDYAIDFETIDFSKPLTQEFLTYNVRDTIVTYKLYLRLIKREYVLEPYNSVLRPSIVSISKMMLVGLPLSRTKLDDFDLYIKSIVTTNMEILHTSSIIRNYVQILKEEAVVKANAKLKKLRKTTEDFDTLVFNPKSSLQVRGLIYGVLKLPSFLTTKKGDISTKKSNLSYTKEVILKKPNENTKEIVNILDALLLLADTSTLASTFIPAFYKPFENSFNYNGTHFLRGSLNIGGTLSGRLSSSKPNLQNLPSNSIFGGAIKSILEAPTGYLLATADFASLEDRILTIQTQAENKLKIYTDGFDGHSLNTYEYFKDQMPDILNTLESINSIQDKYYELRSASKTITFALAYGGTAYTLIKNSGFTQKEADALVISYQKAYPEIIAMRQHVITELDDSGYITLAFGLRIWAYHRYIRNNYSVFSNIQGVSKEENSCANAFTQSWGLLINRAINATEAILKSTPCFNGITVLNTVHDSVYYLIKNDPVYIKTLNDILIKEMQFNNMPAIKSDDVPMEAILEIGKDLKHLHKIPNGASILTISKILKDKINEI